MLRHRGIGNALETTEDVAASVTRVEFMGDPSSSEDTPFVNPFRDRYNLMSLGNSVVMDVFSEDAKASA